MLRGALVLEELKVDWTGEAGAVDKIPDDVIGGHWASGGKIGGCDWLKGCFGTWIRLN